MDGKMNSLIICLYSLKILGALGFNPYLCAQKMNDGMIKRYCFFLFLGMSMTDLLTKSFGVSTTSSSLLPCPSCRSCAMKAITSMP